VYDLAHHWGILPEALAAAPCTHVDDMLAFADYDASRRARWKKDAEWRSKRDHERADVKQESKARAILGPRHTE
jgi:hypothetical protein